MMIKTLLRLAQTWSYVGMDNNQELAPFYRSENELNCTFNNDKILQKLHIISVGAAVQLDRDNSPYSLVLLFRAQLFSTSCFLFFYQSCIYHFSFYI